MIAERSEYKGNKMIVLKRNETEKYPFTFGLSKAKLVVEGIEEIKKFIMECETGVANDVKVDKQNVDKQNNDDIPY